MFPVFREFPISQRVTRDESHGLASKQCVCTCDAQQPGRGRADQESEVRTQAPGVRSVVPAVWALCWAKA